MTIEPTATGHDVADRTVTGPDMSGHDMSGWWVVGVDGSECSANAAAWAAAHAPGRARGLQIVTAWEAPTIAAYPMSTPSVVSIDDTEMRVAAQHSTDALAERVGQSLDLPVEAYMGRGGPAEVLIAASEAADLLVVGSRGRGGFARLILGSTSTQCATHASVPTVVVPEDAHPVGTRRILVGFDGSPNATDALRWAVQFALPGSTVVAAWVWDATPLAVGADAFFFPDASDLAVERFHHLLVPIQEHADRVGVTLEREFLRGTPRAALAAHSDGVDLVVLGARGHGSVGAALLGSVSTWILHHVHRPVAVVPVGVSSTMVSPEPPPDVFHG
jgi:nucleotide-binding universal stress UspA family protein